MKKFLLAAALLLFSVPAFAGAYEDAISSGDPVFLYLYTKQCGYCKKFSPLYDKLIEGNYKDKYKFIKVDANSDYGMQLMDMYKAGYVPFVVLADGKRQKLRSILPSCLLNTACTEKELNLFIR